MIIDVFDPVLCPERTRVQKHIAAKIKWMGSLLVLVSSATFKPHTWDFYLYVFAATKTRVDKKK